MSEPHPICIVPDVQENVDFVQAQELAQLPKPWPRCQDLPKNTFSSPSKDDLVLAVSHAWPYGAHPDPMADKASLIDQLVADANTTHRPQGKTVLFVDFLSVSQRPFARGQGNRTKEEEDAFAKALRAFPQIYLQADAVIHVDVDTHQVPEDGDTYQVPVSSLEDLDIKQLGDALHVVSWPKDPNSEVAAFDMVESVGGRKVRSMEEFNKLKNAAQASKGRPPFPWACCTPDPTVATLRRAPFGKYNKFAAGQKGWVYLERFASMVKAAMVPEDQAPGVAFATSKSCLEEIMDGSRRLRKAAMGGKQSLYDALQYFVKELDAKQFSAVSVDKATNTGGVGGLKASEAPSKPSDKEIVGRLMQELVDDLSANWEREQAAQRQRQLVLAVSRGDTSACRQLIEAGADANKPDMHGLTCLHAAANFRDLGVVKVLIEMGGDLLAKDMEGNCPAHRLGLYAEENTVPLFEQLAPTQEVLELPNKAGIRPIQRFALWASTAVQSKPYPPAADFVKAIQEKYPRLSVRGAARKPITARDVPKTFAESKQDVTVGGKKITFTVWQPKDGKVSMDIVYLGMAVYAPWNMQQRAVEIVAGNACGSFPVKIWACDHLAALQPLLEKKPLEEGVAHMKAVINALPLKGKFLFVDNSCGQFSPLVWEFKDRLLGALLLNPLGWFSEDFYGSETHEKITGMITKNAKMYEAQDIEGATKTVGNFSYTSSPDEIEDIQKEYKAALTKAPKDWFKFQWCIPEWSMKELTLVMQKKTSMGGFPVTLACGAHSPALFVQETCGRLKTVLQNSKIEYIPDSKQWWEVEGLDQVQSVSGLLNDLIKEVVGGQ